MNSKLENAGAALLLAIASAAAPAAGTLAAYADEAEFVAALDRWRAEAQRLRAAPAARGGPTAESATAGPLPMAPPPAAAAQALGKSAGTAEASITNVQTAGVDEGGIVKRAGDFLVVLRRGRLFTLRIGGDALAPVAAVEAYAPDVNPRGSWYDELLVAGRSVVVVGYSTARGGTEIGLFDLGGDGTLAYRGTWHLRSFDYYAARNYASRLVGRRLVFYSPTLLSPWGPHPATLLPGLRPWQGAATPPSFERILPATRIHSSDDDFDPREPLALHTVTSCELPEAAPMRCESTAVLGAPGRVFYVARDAVYVWTHRGGSRAGAVATVFRLPLDGRAPSALKAAGVPIDMMSFLESDDAHLNVLLRASGPGEGMWGSERSRGAMALLRVPLAAFGDGRGAAGPEHYRLVPAVAGAAQNRYVGPWLLWGGSPAQGRDSSAWALRWDDAQAQPQPLATGGRVERIEALGTQALLVGGGGSARDLAFDAVRLGEREASLAGRYVQPESRQGETRTHGFFYRADGDDHGVLGLPLRRQGGAGILFLRHRALAFEPLGELQAQAPARRDDACKASCVDWYGNARPIFLGERVLALMGYELVEGRLEGGWLRRETLVERRRVDFTPPPSRPAGRYSPFD